MMILAMSMLVRRRCPRQADYKLITRNTTIPTKKSAQCHLKCHLKCASRYRGVTYSVTSSVASSVALSVT